MTDSKIIVAFDGVIADEAKAYAHMLGRHVAGGKVNELLDEAGAGVLNEIYPEHTRPLAAYDCKLPVRMADPKIKDIPQTVFNRVMRYHRKADLLTVHGTNTWKALKQAVAARDINPKSGLKLIAISVTTDCSEKQCRMIYGMSVKRKVVQTVNRVKAAGFDGIVCSPQEVSLVRKMWPKGIIICPGVRSEGADAHDQSRIGTPAQAIADGATYVVSGRQITESKHMVAAAKQINNEIAAVA